MNTKVLKIFELRKQWIQDVNGVYYTDCSVILSFLSRLTFKHIL